MGPTTTYRGLSPRNSVFASKRMLANAQYRDSVAKYARIDELPKNAGDAIKLRRYHDWVVPDSPLSENIDPDFITPTFDDVQITVESYGAAVKLTQKIADMHEDPVFKDQFNKAGKNMGRTSFRVNWNGLICGLNVYYGGSASAVTRVTVDGTVSNNMLKKIHRQLMATGATPISRRQTATPNIGTEPVPETFIIVGHTNLKADFEALNDWIPLQKMPKPDSQDPYCIGAVEGFTVILNPDCTYFKAAGASTTAFLTNDNPGTGACDVYPFVVLSEDCFSCVPLAGKRAVKPMVLNPGEGALSMDNAFGRFGLVSWQGYFAAGITNDDWLARGEVAVTAL